MCVMKLYHVDAFSGRVFGGNPAAVIIPEQWPEEALMQSIASENNLSETAFAVRSGEGYTIRWFTPLVEVDLCGHATMATAHVLFNHLGHPSDTILFRSPRSGDLPVTRTGELITLDFPADNLQEATVPGMVSEALGKSPVKVFRGRSDYLLIYDSPEDIASLDPDFGRLAGLGSRGVIVTARGVDVDFVSRFFAPGVGINEDPVTGSAHTTLTPYWAGALGKKRLSARQISARQGELECELAGSRIRISGRAVTYMTGEILL